VHPEFAAALQEWHQAEPQQEQAGQTRRLLANRFAAAASWSQAAAALL
jgi:hypothetical protein